MFKPALIAGSGLLAAALSLTAPATLTAISACDVSSSAEAIQWGQSHPGQSHVLMCRAATKG